MYSDAGAAGRPRAITVRSAVATVAWGLPRLAGPAARAAHRGGDRRLEGVAAAARVQRAVLRPAGAAGRGGGRSGVAAPRWARASPVGTDAGGRGHLLQER